MYLTKKEVSALKKVVRMADNIDMTKSQRQAINQLATAIKNNDRRIQRQRRIIRDFYSED